MASANDLLTFFFFYIYTESLIGIVYQQLASIKVASPPFFDSD